MLRWIRPWGVAGFVAFTAIVAAFWILLADWMVERTVETVGTRIVGAEVELASADLSFSPLGFQLRGLQVTNPEQPMQNLMQLDAASGLVDPWQLLLGKVIVDELAVDGVRFNTARQRSGAVRGGEAPTAGDKAGLEEVIGAAREQLPGVDEILQREPLVTPQRAEELQQSTATHRSQVQEAVAALPDEAKLESYEQRVKELTGGDVKSVQDLQQRREQLQQLQQEIRQDKQAVETAHERVVTAKQTLSEQFTALKNAPQEDLARIRERYGLNAMGASNLTRLLFGDQAQKWFDLTRTWYGRLARFLPGDDGAPQPDVVKPQRGEGRLVHFREQQALPQFLVREARVNAQLPFGDVAARLQDVTHQPQVLGRPMRLTASGENLPAAEALNVKGVFDHTNPAQPVDTLNWDLKRWRLSDVAVSRDDTLPLTLARAVADMAGDVKLVDGALTAQFDTAFQDAQWQSGATEGWAGRVAQALQSISQFTVAGAMTGGEAAPELSLRSNLDEALKGAAKTQLKSRQAELEQQLRTRLNAQVEQAGGPYREQLTALNRTEGDLRSRIDQMEQLLKAELQSALESQKEQAKEKAEGKLKEKLKGLGF